MIDSEELPGRMNLKFHIKISFLSWWHSGNEPIASDLDLFDFESSFRFELLSYHYWAWEGKQYQKEDLNSISINDSWANYLDIFVLGFDCGDYELRGA